MEKKDLDFKISSAAKSLLSYCIMRTSSRFDAEDLAHDIILEMYKSSVNIRNDDAFYGFMWAVAGNVYKQWCRKKQNFKVCDYDNNYLFYSDILYEDDTQLNLLRRELSLLSEKYRKAVILYYIENKSCSQISDILSVSESMVKYLLFKSRKILKEGITMERTYGEQSYNPKELSILYWGNGKKTYNSTLEKRIAQNILFACYNDKLTAEEISLELGVSLPYIEDILKELTDCDILRLEGRKYYTNIVIFTSDCAIEIVNKTAGYREEIVKALTSVAENSDNQAWLSVCCVLYKAVFENLQSKVEIDIPENKFGENCLMWAVEKEADSVRNKGFDFGVSNTENENGDRVQFFDFSVNGEMVHHNFYTNPNITDIFVDIAKGKTDFKNEFDKVIVAELVKKGYVINDSSKLSVNVSVFTKTEFDSFINPFEKTVEIVENNVLNIMNKAAKIIGNYIPVHLKPLAGQMAYFRIFEDAVSMTVAKLVENRVLFPYNGTGKLPTTYVMLNE